jgi:hypothetical protein
MMWLHHKLHIIRALRTKDLNSFLKMEVEGLKIGCRTSRIVINVFHDYGIFWELILFL